MVGDVILKIVGAIIVNGICDLSSFMDNLLFQQRAVGTSKLYLDWFAFLVVFSQYLFGTSRNIRCIAADFKFIACDLINERIKLNAGIHGMTEKIRNFRFDVRLSVFFIEALNSEVY